MDGSQFPQVEHDYQRRVEQCYIASGSVPIPVHPSKQLVLAKVRWRNIVLILGAFLFFASASWAQSQDWLRISAQDLRMKEFPAAPGAAAVQLYYADYIDDQEQTEFVYRRIKILKDNGKSYAD